MRYATATRDGGGSYAMVYLPTGKAVAINLDKLTGAATAAWWFDPREGRAQRIGPVPAKGTRQFRPPTSGAGQDWVLVLDDVRKRFPAPGTSE